MTAPLLSLITTCKGRLRHLEESLPRMLAQPACECIVVDYDCPDRAGDWVAEHHPGVRLVRAVDEPIFRHGHARNLGAAMAAAPWLAFVDADTLLAPDYAREVIAQRVPGHYYRPAPLTPDVWGNVVCEKSAFALIAGYDEVMRGWGAEDDDLYLRLAHAGCRPATYSGDLVASVAHDTVDRVRFSDIGDRWVSQRAHALYCHIKFDLMRQAGTVTLPIETRRAIYEEVRRTVVADAAQGAIGSRITVHLPTEPLMPIWGWSIRREWTFNLEKIPNVPPPPP
ncbi:MAG: glycosyltransferase family A protein [Sulfuritalea sp.]|nr:glycosyltransferase family A protein [Sulfuritalea sp.]MDP1984968.1 glycosyltransferase family A protein [Sulfuritalea sp.]